MSVAEDWKTIGKTNSLRPINNLGWLAHPDANNIYVFVRGAPVGYEDSLGLVTGDFKELPERRADTMSVRGTLGYTKVGYNVTPDCRCAGLFRKEFGNFTWYWNPQFDFKMTTEVFLQNAGDKQIWLANHKVPDPEANAVFQQPNSSQAMREAAVRKHENKHVSDAKETYIQNMAALELSKDWEYVTKVRCQKFANYTAIAARSEIGKEIAASQADRR